MLSLFADQEREAKLDSLGDPLALLNKHVDFRLMAEEIDRWVPRPSRAKGGRPPYPTELMTRLLSCSSCSTCPTNRWSFNYSTA